MKIDLLSTKTLKKNRHCERQRSNPVFLRKWIASPALAMTYVDRLPKTFTLLVILFLSSCVTSQNHKEQFYQAANSEIDGKIHDFFTSENNNLFKHHQKSKIEWIDEGGNVKKSYNFSERKLGMLSYVPIFSFFLPRNYENHEIIVTFKNGAAVDMKSFDGVITLSSESFCHEAIFSCVKKQENVAK